MTNTIAEQALLPFAAVEHDAASLVSRSASTERPPLAKPSDPIALNLADPEQIAFHPAFGGAEDVLARRYEKDAAAIASRLVSGNEHPPIAVSLGNEDGSYILIGHPAELLAARAVHVDDPTFRVSIVVLQSLGPAAHYGG